MATCSTTAPGDQRSRLGRCAGAAWRGSCTTPTRSARAASGPCADQWKRFAGRATARLFPGTTWPLSLVLEAAVSPTICSASFYRLVDGPRATRADLAGYARPVLDLVDSCRRLPARSARREVRPTTTPRGGKADAEIVGLYGGFQATTRVAHVVPRKSRGKLHGRELFPLESAHA